MSLLDDLRAEGLTVETWPNWENHEAPKPSYVSAFRPVGVLMHWDAANGFSPNTYFNNPRFDAPSYHIAIEKDGTVWLGSQGYVYGAGGGDSAVYRAMKEDRPVPPARIEKDMNGNPHFWSVCFNYMPGTKKLPGPALPAAQYDAGVKVAAALCRRDEWNPQYRTNDHDGWTTRKDDLSGSAPGNWWAPPSNWDLQRFRTDVKQRLEADMADPKIPMPEWAEGSVAYLNDRGYFPAGVPTEETLDMWRTYVYLARSDKSLWNRIVAWTKDHVKGVVAAAFASGVGAGQIDYQELVAEIGRILSGG